MITSADILKAGILIVDDNDANVSLLEQMLRGAGYVSITSTSNPREVCELHREHRYALILLDLQMPGLDGFQVMEGLKAIETGGYLPVLVQTSQPNHKVRALKAGARDFVSKPFDFVEVLLRVHNLIEVRLLKQEAELRSEQAETRSERSEFANLAKSRFLANVSHELRTPLNAVIGFSELLADQTFGALNERQLKYSNNILNSGRHLLQLINDILDLAKVETGHLELRRNTFGVAKALSEAQTIVKTLAYKKGIDLCVEAAADLPPLFADEAKFKQIMYNLLSNAIKFTPDGGKVFVTAALQSTNSADSNPSGKSMQVAVRDTGIGIKLNDQERIFKEFEQVDSSYGRQQQGTGLGLALTKKLVEMHGGRIWVESEGAQNKGSTFTFVIPIPKEPDQPAKPDDQPRPFNDIIRPSVLVVANDGFQESPVSRYLTGAGYDVIVISEVAAMIAALKARRPYAVVIDRSIGSPGITRGGADPLPERPESYFPDTLMQHKCCSHVPAGIPRVIFAEDGSGRLKFSLLGKKINVPEPASSTLAGAIRCSDKTGGNEIKTILIIDDEPVLLELLTTTLLQEGFRVIQAADSREGVEFATTYLPEIIILDFVMPGFDGIQIVEQLRAHPRTKNIPILINTGMVLNEAERQRLAGHVQGIISKTEQSGLFAELERLEAMGAQAVTTGANP